MLSDEIKRTREQLGLTQGQLAKRFGVALNTVSRWENKTSQPEGEGMIRLALKQLEQEAVFNDGALMEQIQAKIDLLQKSKEELEEIVTQQLAAEEDEPKSKVSTSPSEAQKRRIRAAQQKRWLNK